MHACGTKLGIRFVLFAWFVLGLGACQLPAQEVVAPLPAPAEAAPTDSGWPRKMNVNGTTVTAYQPQVDSWDKNNLVTRIAVSLQDAAAPTPTFGVVWIQARTEVDKETKHVTLEDTKITKVSFPSKPNQADQYKTLLSQALPSQIQGISLDRLQASLAVTRAEAKAVPVPLKNDPPRIIYSAKPAILVLIDGKPVLRKVANSRFLRVINTRELILFDDMAATYYLYFMDHWMQSQNIETGWTPSVAPPAEVDTIKTTLAQQGTVDLLDDPSPDLKQDMEAGNYPDLYVSTVPTELVQTQGDLQFASIDGTNLLWVTNTQSDVLFDTAGQFYYVRLSGRWFRARVLNGPWEYIAGDKLPADFARVPDNHPKGDILASVAGTPQAKESVISNSIPQTATIKRSEAKFTANYDGDPQFQPIPDTNLSYALNTASPVIKVAENIYYAIENGIWFNATAPAGPWAVATEVPPVIYTIPPASPIYYVTSAQVYGYTPDYVYVGYTPGYYGTCLAPYGCLVYGTGWPYTPWIGNYWFGRPWSYGYGATFHYSPVAGWGFGFDAGIGRPWWGPLGWGSYHGGAWRSGWVGGGAYGARYDNVHATNVNVNNFNLYNRWGHGAVVNTHNAHINNINATNINARRTDVTNVRNTNVNAARTDVNNLRNTNIGTREGNFTNITNRGLNNVYAGHDGNVYRRGAQGWEQNAGEGWRNFGPAINNAGERRPDGAGAFNNPQIANRGLDGLDNRRFDGFENRGDGRFGGERLNDEFSARRFGDADFNSFRNNGGFAGYRGGGRGGFRGGRR